MNKQKVIFLCYLPINEQLEKHHFINELIHDGISVEFWDLSNIFFPGIKFATVERNYEKKVRNYNELKKMIRSEDVPNCVFAVLISTCGVAPELHRILTKYNCYLIFFALRSGYPVFSEKTHLLKKLMRLYNSGSFLRSLKQKFLYVLTRIYIKIKLIKNYDLIFVAGSAELSTYEKTSSKVINFNHFDYDDYFNIRNLNTRFVGFEYCVFIDDNLIYDTDFKALKVRTVEPNSYYSSLCTFFDYLEKEFKLKVIIAAHPKAEYKGSEFRGRILVKGKTSELVKNCTFALAHYSTAISFAILFKKPILFIYTKDMTDLPYFRSISGFAQLLNSRLCNIDTSTLYPKADLPKSIPVDYARYDDYKYKYLTSKLSENELSCNLFMKNMKNMKDLIFNKNGQMKVQPRRDVTTQQH